MSSGLAQVVGDEREVMSGRKRPHEGVVELLLELGSNADCSSARENGLKLSQANRQTALCCIDLYVTAQRPDVKFLNLVRLFPH